MTATTKVSVKQRLRTAVESLPDEATWDDVHYMLYVVEKVDRALNDTRPTLTTEEVRQRLGLDE